MKLAASTLIQKTMMAMKEKKKKNKRNLIQLFDSKIGEGSYKIKIWFETNFSKDEFFNCKYTP